MCGACNASYYIFFIPFKKPLAKEIVMKRSRSLAPCAKLLGFQRLFLNTKMVASKEDPMFKMLIMCPYE
jgi:hypothetical protein